MLSSGPSLTLKAWSRASKTPVYAKALLCLASCFTVQLIGALSQRPSFGAGENQQLTCHVSPPELPSFSPTAGMLRTGKCQLGRAFYLGNRGHRQEMLAGLSTNVSAAGACIVWLESVGFSQREGMSRSISDSKRHSLKPATQLSFLSTGSSEQLLPGIYQQVRSSRIFPHPVEERQQMMCPELALQNFRWVPSWPAPRESPQVPRLWKLEPLLSSSAHPRY